MNIIIISPDNSSQMTSLGGLIPSMRRKVAGQGGDHQTPREGEGNTGSKNMALCETPFPHERSTSTLGEGNHQMSDRVHERGEEKMMEERA